MADLYFLEVLLYGDPVGTLTCVGGDRIFFAFNDSYIRGYRQVRYQSRIQGPVRGTDHGVSVYADAGDTVFFEPASGRAHENLSGGSRGREFRT